MSKNLQILALFSFLIFSLGAANAQSVNTVDQTPSISLMPNLTTQSIINFDGVYQRRGKADGSCCYALVDPLTGKPTGTLRANADLTIKGKSGTFVQFPDPKINLDFACGQQKVPVEVVEINGATIVFTIKRDQLRASGCSNELITLVHNNVDGKVGLSPPRRQEILMYTKVSD